jgi:hypothetical protein
MLLSAIALWSVARVPAAESSLAAIGPGSDKPREIETISLRLEAAAEPEPPLRYSLLPPFAKLKPGNAAIYYYRALLLMPRQEESRFGDTQETWMQLPAAEMPPDEVEKWLGPYNNSLGELQRAALCESCNWDLRLRDLAGFDAIQFLLPELQETRQLGRVLRLKSRLEIAQGRYEDAIQTMQLGFCLARDVGKAPTLIHGLVGIAIASMMNQSVVDWIDAGGPNLYWALTMMPDPLIDLRIALQQERNLPLQFLPFLDDPENKDWSEQQWRDAFAEGIEQVLSVTGDFLPYPEDDDVRRLLTRLASVGWLMTYYPEARAALIESGMDPDRVAAMPVGKVLAIQAARVQQHIYQHTFKWSYLPIWQSVAGSRATEQRLQEEGYLSSGIRSRQMIPLASLLMPSVRSAMYAGGRIQREMAVLRTIEGLRTYLATHDGRFPAELREVSQTPVPLDPITGEFFHWQVGDGRAEVVLPSVPDVPNVLAKRYELKLVRP